jgi:hypothetical protein
MHDPATEFVALLTSDVKEAEAFVKAELAKGHGLAVRIEKDLATGVRQVIIGLPPKPPPPPPNPESLKQ